MSIPRTDAPPGMRKPDIAHVGYHRTGTKFLQWHVFSRLEEHVFVGQNIGAHWLNHVEEITLEGAQAYFTGEQARNAEDKPFLISQERLSGHAFKDDLAVPRVFADMNPQMKIILVLRSQYDIFRSLYHLHAKVGGPRHYGDFVAAAAEGGRCDYLAMVERYRAFFGADQLLVLLFEELKQARQDFVARICAFMAVPSVAIPEDVPAVNPSPSDAVLRYQRLANAALGLDGETRRRDWRHALRNAGETGIKRAERLCSRPLSKLNLDAERARIEARYAPGNRRLAELIGKPLGDYGYPV